MSIKISGWITYKKVKTSDHSNELSIKEREENGCDIQLSKIYH